MGPKTAITARGLARSTLARLAELPPRHNPQQSALYVSTLCFGTTVAERVLRFQPRPGRAAAIRRVQPLRYNALEAEPASMVEHCRAVVFQMLIVGDSALGADLPLSFAASQSLPKSGSACLQGRAWLPINQSHNYISQVETFGETTMRKMKWSDSRAFPASIKGTA